MKTMILAAAVVLTFGAGAAYAGDGEGPIPNTAFTEAPNVIAQAPGYYSNRAYAATQNGGSTSLFVTQQHPVSTFPSNPNEGGGG
ncbi:MAG TPA: hypothetical protein VL614_18935 [Acetobacteraceae bacterium]|jgi:hypothetical protein|nr:hypothetical protein [Acetobacteraceae bacterium]